MKFVARLLDELEGQERNSYPVKIMRARETKSYLVPETAMTLSCLLMEGSGLSC